MRTLCFKLNFIQTDLNIFDASKKSLFSFWKAIRNISPFYVVNIGFGFAELCDFGRSLPSTVGSRCDLTRAITVVTSDEKTVFFLCSFLAMTAVTFVSSHKWRHLIRLGNSKSLRRQFDANTKNENFLQHHQSSSRWPPACLSLVSRNSPPPPPFLDPYIDFGGDSQPWGSILFIKGSVKFNEKCSRAGVNITIFTTLDFSFNFAKFKISSGAIHKLRRQARGVCQMSMLLHKPM